MPDTTPHPPATCSRCGAALPKAGADCPRCLLELGLKEPAQAQDDLPPRASSDPGPPGLPASTPPTLDEVRAAFPDLEVEALLGRGGMGAVFKARQKKLQRTVAIKVLPRALGEDPAFADRFLREARALAKLSHPGIVAVYDFGQSAGLFFLVMEYVDGLDLRHLLRQGLMEPRQALTITRDLCGALQYAHDEGVVHRDIKPENVLLDTRGRVKIADFGLAKLVHPGTDGFLSRADQVMGTPHYMAPEQLERPREVDHRADLFALGVVLYEMLTGSLPRGNFELPSHRVHVDVRLDEIVLKALEREPERRYQQALEVQTDVDLVSTSARSASPSHDEPFVEITAGKWHTVARLPFPGARALALLAAMWIALAALWNLGTLAFGAGFGIVGIVLAVIANGRLRTDPELSAALEAQPRRKQALRVLVLLGPLVAGLSAIAAGHYFHWERGTRAWVPAHRGVMGAFQAWKGDLFGLMQIGGKVPVGIEPQLAMSKSYTTGSGEFWGSFSPWILMGIGFVLLALAITEMTYVREPQELRRRSWKIGAEISSCAFGALFALWIGAPIATLRGEMALHAVDRRIETELDLEKTVDRLYQAFRGEELHVDVDQRLVIHDRRTGEEVLPIVLHRAQKTSPFDRFSTSFAGPRRVAPQIWATVVPRVGVPGTAILLRAGLYDSRSEEGQRANELLTRLHAALRDG